MQGIVVAREKPNTLGREGTISVQISEKLGERKKNMPYRGKETAFQRRGRNDLCLLHFNSFLVLISTKTARELVKCRFQFSRSTFLTHSR